VVRLCAAETAEGLFFPVALLLFLSLSVLHHRQPGLQRGGPGGFAAEQGADSLPEDVCLAYHSRAISDPLYKMDIRNYTYICQR